MFGQRIRELRLEKDLTMKEFGKKFSVAESTISGYENETRKPDLDMLNRFADFFDVDTDYILGRTNDRSRKREKSIEIDTGGVNIAYFGGAKEELTVEEAERLKEELEMFRMLKAKRMRERQERQKE